MTNTPSTAATNTIPLHPEEVEYLKKLYAFKEPSAVWQFLTKYPFLVPILLEAPDKIHPYFPNEQLLLEVVPDPEIIDYVHLVLSILTKDESNDVVYKLDCLDEDWSLGLSYQVKKHFIITLGYPDEF